jgi:hypothetical protein
MVAAVAVTILVAGYLTLQGFSTLTARDLGEVKPVPAGDQEIALIDAATSSEVWERLVAALRNLEQTWPKIHPTRLVLHVDYGRAFLEQTADIPEVVLWVGDNPGPRLWLRWYKVSSEAHSQSWVEKLSRRPPTPLAVIGGDTSDRALRLGRLLRDARNQWTGPAPLFLITTATADRYDPKDNPDPVLTRTDWPRLIDVYKDRSFRFSFTNTRMAEAVMDFVQTHPEIWTDSNLPAFAPAFGSDPWQNLALAAAQMQLQEVALFTLSWNDDRYSLDLSDRFAKVFMDNFVPDGAGRPARIVSDKVDYSVGDYYQPNPSEVLAVDRFLLERGQAPARRQLLALPIGAQPARRFLRTLIRRAPRDARQLVVVTGDSIGFDSIYRDRDTAWNILDLPVPLVLFCHRNPVDENAGFRLDAETDRPSATTGTQDLLLHRDLMEAVLTATFSGNGMVRDADELNLRLRQSRWKKGRVFAFDPVDGSPDEGVPLFDADGDRHSPTGEHIVWLKPLYEDQRTLPQAVITVWRLRSEDAASGWRQVREEPLHVSYERGR